MASVPTNKVLYSRVKTEAKRKFKVWPSAYGSGWLVKEYKRRGGKYRVSSKSTRKSSKKRRKSSKKRRKSTKKRRKSSKKRRKSTKKRRKSTKKRRKSKSSKKRRKSSKKRSRAPVKKSPIKTYYKKSPIASKPKKSKKSKKITIRRRPQLSRQMSVEDRNFYRPSARLPLEGEGIPLAVRMESQRRYLDRISRQLPPYRGSRAPKRSKKKSLSEEDPSLRRGSLNGVYNQG